MNETKQYLISEMKRVGIKLNYFCKDDYNGELRYPKVKGTIDQINMAKAIISFYKIKFNDWRKVK